MGERVRSAFGMLRASVIAVIGFVIAAVWGSAASAQSTGGGDPKRFALLIGNQAYAATVGALKNPKNDIALIATTLRSIGFAKENVTIVHDANRVTILNALDAFADRVNRAGPDAIAFFYYSGHGAASKRNRRNYLIPVGVKALNRSIWNEAVALDRVVSKLADQAPAAAHFVIFDACRNLLQMPTKGSKGFMPVAERRGMLIAFSTDPGETASDEGDGAGPYASALARELGRPGQHHLDLFQNVKEQVFRQTGSQVPWERNGLLNRIYLSGRQAKSVAGSASVANEAAIAWSAIANSGNRKALEAFKRRYPGSFFAELAEQRLASLQTGQRPGPKPSEKLPTLNPAPISEAPAVAADDTAVGRKLDGGRVVLTGPQWQGKKGYRRVSKEEAEFRLGGYTVVYGNGSREYHDTDGKTKIWRKRRNSFSYGRWTVSGSGRLSYRYGKRQGCWGYVLYNAQAKKFRVDWRKAICKFGFARFIEGEHLK